MNACQAAIGKMAIRRPTSRCDQLRQRRPEPVEPVTLAQRARLGSRHDHVVVAGGQIIGQRPERVAQQPLDPIAIDGAADLARDRDAEARSLSPPRGNE